jgi:hypothetical protein
MTVLKCDFDGRFPAGICNRLGFIARQNRVRVIDLRIDRTRHGWHLTARLSGRVSPLRLVLMQALCGSDYRRECYNGVRAMRLRGTSPFWRDRFNQLFTNHHRRVVI